jgi:hypothetical protein
MIVGSVGYKMKKILTCGVILALGAFQLPALADDNKTAGSWSDLSDGITENEKANITLTQTINASASDSAITNKATFDKKILDIPFPVSHEPIINLSTYSIIGPGGTESVFINEGKLTINGTVGSVIDSNGSSSAAIFNGLGGLFLSNVTINGGISMGSTPQNTNGTLQIGTSGSSNSTVILSGAANSIIGGTVSFGGTGNTLEINGGVFNTAIESNSTSGAAFTLNTGNTLTVSGGTVHFADGSWVPGGADTTWSGGLLNLTGGQLTIEKAVDAAGINYVVNPLYTQSGGALTINGYNLNLSNLASSITGGSVAFQNVSSLTLDNGQSNNAAITMTQAASTLTISNGNGNTSLTLDSGSSITGGTISMGSTPPPGAIILPTSTITVGSGATIDPSQMNIYERGLLNVSGGTATLDNSDLWLGYVELQSGSLNLNEVTSNAAYSQTGGTANISSGSSLTLASGSNITTSGSGVTSTVNIGGGTPACTLALNGGSITTAVAGGTTNINIGADSSGNPSNGNTLNVSNASSSITNGASGATNINIGVGAAQNNALNLSAGSITGTGTTVAVGTITAGSANNALTVSGTGNIDESATIVLNANNNLNINGGTVNLNQGGSGIDALTGAVNLSGGDLYLDSIISNILINQTGGTVIGQDGISGSSAVTGEHHFHGGNVELRTNSNLKLAFPDTWTTSNFAIKGGTLTLDAFSHDSTNALTLGTLTQTSGTTRLINGSALTMNLDAANSALNGGSVVVNDSTLNLSTTAGATVGASLSGNSNGIINKNGAGILTLTGRNSGYYGALNVNAGSVDFNASSGNTDSYISGTTTLAAGSSLTLNTNGTNVISSSNNVSGGIVNKTGAGEYTVLAGSNGTINYELNVNGGSMKVVADAPINFSAPVAVNSSILTLSAGDTNFNDGLTLDHGYLNVLNGGFNVNNGLTVGSTVNTMNGVALTNTITGDLNIGASGTAEFLIDISPNTGASDNYVIEQVAGVGGNITTTNPTGIIQISDFKIIGTPTDVRSANLQIFAPEGTIDGGVSFTATDKIVKSTASMYSLSASPSQNGGYTLNWQGYNPEAFRGQVATQSAYANQLTTNSILFDHIGLVSQQLLSEEKPNVYANENPLYAPYQYSKKDGGLWYKGYGNLERLQLSQGINTQNNLWGSLVGADFPLVQLKNGWSVLPTAYVGYTGAYQTYNGVNMYQNGGQGGIMGTFYKGDFITSLLANVGGYGNDMSLEGTRDATGNWFAGIASKSAYNIKLPKDFILQPNMLVSYNAFGGQKWGSDYGSTSMTTNMMNGLNLAPGLNLILNKKTWSVYATTQLMCNLMNGTSGTVGDVNLPTVKMANTYFQYGLGVTKRIKERVSMYGQIVMSNGVRTGVGFQGGLQWKF